MSLTSKEKKVLLVLSESHDGDMSMAEIGDEAFPSNYRISVQGSVLAVCREVKSLQAKGLIVDTDKMGISKRLRITQDGRKALAALGEGGGL